jgi:benzodiazapine receptor
MKNSLLNWLLWIVVIAINALANILPINGMNTGQISGFYPNYFVPAGFTFGIWSIIYLLLLAYTIAFPYYTRKKEDFTGIQAYLKSISRYYWATCLLNGSWILAWHYLQVLLSVVIMLCFLYCLIRIFQLSIPYYKTFSFGQRITLHAPFVVYAGWISVATIANITAWLVHQHWTGWNIPGPLWSTLMIIIALLLGIYITLRYAVSAYALVIAWALWGIYKGQGANSTLLTLAPLIGLTVLLLLSLVVFIINLKKQVAPTKHQA